MLLFLDLSVTSKFDFSYSNRMVQQVPENISFPAEEEKILQFWSKFNCFQECLKQSKHRPKYVNFFGEGGVF
jgi:isoleucyl-tRNA synthetase